MPTYQNTLPPTSLWSGDIGFSFNNEAFPGAGTAGSQFTLPSYTGLAGGGAPVRWQMIFGSAPTAVNIELQAAINNVDAEYQTIETSTATTGEGRSLANVQARFVRIKVVSSTGGSGLTVKIRGASRGRPKSLMEKKYRQANVHESRAVSKPSRHRKAIQSESCKERKKNRRHGLYLL